MSPVFSILIPTYNRFHLLCVAIESVFKQTFKQYEIIVVDDGSTDDTCSRLQRKFSSRNLRIVKQDRKGVSSARNRGFQEAQGEWIALLDSDDLWEPLKLEKQFALIRSSDFLIQQTNEVWLRNGDPLVIPKKYNKKSGDLFDVSLKYCAISPSAVVLHRDLWSQNNGFDERLLVCEDYHFWLKISSQYLVGLVEDSLVIKRGGHSDQLSRQEPAMDRFRIWSMLDLLSKTDLNFNQQKLLRRELKYKIEVLQVGSKKRKRHGSVFDDWLTQFDQLPVNQELLKRIQDYCLGQGNWGR